METTRPDFDLLSAGHASVRAGLAPLAMVQRQLDALRAEFDLTGAWLFGWEDGELRLVAQSGDRGDPTRAHAARIAEDVVTRFRTEDDTEPVRRSEEWVALPMRYGTRLLGVLILDDRLGNGQELPTTLPASASPLVVSLELAQLRAADRRQQRETATLHASLSALIASVDHHAVLDVILEQLRRVIPYDSSAVLLLDGEALEVVAGAGFPEHVDIVGKRFPTPNALFDEICARKETIYLADTTQDERFLFWADTTYIRSWMGVPLLLDNQVVGYITLDRREPKAYQPEEIELAQIFARHGTIAIQKSRLFAEARRRTRQLERLAALSGALRLHGAQTEIIEQVLATASTMFNARVATLALPDETASVIHLEVWEHDSLSPSVEVPLETSLVGHVYRTGRTFVTSDLFREPMAQTSALDLLRATYSQETRFGMMLAPLQSGDELVGVISVGRPGRFEENDERLLTTLAEIAGAALHRARWLETLEEQVTRRTQELAAANRQLQELDELKNRFIAQVNHDLRTPLTNIKLYLRLLARNNAQRSGQYLEILQREADHLHELIETTLDLSKLDLAQTEQQPAREFVELTGLLREQVERLQDAVRAANLRLTLEVPTSPLHVPGDPAQLAQMTYNILKNAVNFSQEGGALLLRLEPVDGQICLSVRDEGVGIPDAELPHVLRRFYRGTHAQQQGIPGSGLGLSIVNDVVNLHAGRLHLQSMEGEGTTVQVWLPSAVRENRQ